MVDKVKKYVEYELNNISKGFDGSLALERAYGATSFVLYCGWDEELNKIVDEETQGYFKGQKSAKEVAGIIQSRLQIYINEKK